MTTTMSKEIALALLQVIVRAFPPLAELLGSVLEAAPPAQRSLADDVRSILPEDGESARVRRELEAEAAAHREG